MNGLDQGPALSCGRKGLWCPELLIHVCSLLWFGQSDTQIKMFSFGKRFVGTAPWERVDVTHPGMLWEWNGAFLRELEYRAAFPLLPKAGADSFGMSWGAPLCGSAVASVRR